MSCTKCRLHETCRTVQVQSRGSSEPVVMFVGEAPGLEEDQKGKAFVGPSGQLLEQAIKEYGLTPAYITNTVRCAPPGNREPHVDEVEACRPYLVEEIKRLRPKIIVALGNVPLKALTGMTGIASFSGTVVKEVAGIKVFALYHPSWILRFPGNLPKFEMHLRELQRVMTGEEKKDIIQVKDVSPGYVFKILMNQKTEEAVAFDYETTGLFKADGGKVRAVGFYNGIEAFVINTERFAETTPKFMKWFLNSNIEKIAYNSAFEIRWSIEEYGYEPKNLIHDPYLMQFLIDENGGRDLESVASKYCQADRWDISGLMREKGWDHATIPYQYLYPYCGMDCYWTWHLVSAMQKAAPGLRSTPYLEILLPLARLCAKLESTGVKIDTRWALKIDNEYGAEQAKLLKKLNRMEEVQTYSKLKLMKDKNFQFNPGSSLQLREFVFSRLGLRSDKKTKKGGLQSTDQDAMERLVGQHPFIQTYLDWKGITTRRNNFTIKFPTFCDAKDIVHPHYNPIGTVTGRISASDPPAHTFPRPEEDEDEQSIAKVRGMVISRFPGGKLVSNDYSQLELRLLASEAQEESMMEAFAKGQDLHGLTASRIFGSSYTKQQRSIGKTINFAIGYGIQATSLSRKFNVDYETAEQWISQFWKGYRKLYLWIKRQHDFAGENGYIASAFGSVRHLPELPELLKINYPDRSTRYRIYALQRQAANYPIQSAGANINNLACIKIADRLEAEGLQAKLCLPVHDSAMIDTPAKEVKRVAALCREIMEDEMQKVCSWMKVKLKVDQVISSRWGN